MKKLKDWLALLWPKPKVLCRGDGWNWQIGSFFVADDFDNYATIHGYKLTRPGHDGHLIELTPRRERLARPSVS